MTDVPARIAAPARLVGRLDAALAIGAGLAAGVAYLATLAPGLTADIDAALFQFAGRVLGIGHNPGYPLYVLLTWPIAQIPIGSLAWRINLFSAAMGSVAVALTVVAARQLGVGRLAAAAAGLGFGFGATFWAQAVVAEVYTMHAALIGGALASAFAWSRTGRPGLFFAAVGCVAAGLAHHTTIVAFVPALAVLAVVRDRRFALRARTVAAAAAILACGLLPYLLILVRSRDPQAYVEWRATTVPELARVVLGGQFQDRLFTDPWSRAVTDRALLLADRVVVADLTWPGLLLAAFGAVWLLRRRTAEGLCLVAGAVPIAVFAAGYAVVDSPVFLIPVLQVLWICAAAGIDRLAERVGAGGRVPRLGTAVAVAALALPAWLAVRHAPRVDRSGDREARPLQRLFDVLPDRTAIVRADFITDRMVEYLLRGEGAARGRDIHLAPNERARIQARLAAGMSVVAFPAVADSLRFEGFDVAAAPVAVFDGTVDAVIDALPRGTIVALAVPAAHRRAFDRTAGEAYDRLGANAIPGDGALGMIGVAGGASPRVQAAAGVDIGLAPREAPWTPAHGPIQVLVDGDVAAVRLGGRDVVRTRSGAALALFDGGGRLLRAHGVPSAQGFLVPLPPSALSVHAVLGEADRTAIAPGGWVDVTAASATGSLILGVPAGATLELRAGDVQPLAPRVEGNRGRGPVDLSTAAGPSAAPDDPLAGLPWVSRVSVGAEPAAPVAIWLTLGGVPRRAVARLVGEGRGHAAPVSLSGTLRGPTGRSAVVTMHRGTVARTMGAGWSAVEGDDAGPYRWMTAPRARVVVPQPPAPWRTVRIEAFRPAGRPQGTLSVALGPHVLPPVPLRPGWADYHWAVPADVAARLTAAPVDVTVVVDAPEAAAPNDPDGFIAVASMRFTE
jgi:hypothetical protein